MKLIITIDTEEDNWGNYTRTENTCSNLEQLHRLQGLFDNFSIIPTYLITYPVVKDERSQAILKGFLFNGKCEIGTHCHPWNTPPYEEELNAANTMLTNLSSELVQKKITVLHNAIIETFGITPVTFRSGRFAFNSSVAKALTILNYNIDTSVTPYEDQGAYLGPDFSNFSPEPYVFSEEDIFTPRVDGSLVELPVSIGYLQKNFKLSNILHQFFRKKPFNSLKIIGVLSYLHLMNKASLRPENCTEKEMIGIARVFMKKKYNVINMMLHSTSLMPGFSPFTKTLQDEERIFHRIKAFLNFASDNGIEFIKVSDSADIVRSAHGIIH